MNHLLVSALYQLQLDASILRRIQYVIDTPEFNELFDKASNKEEILYYIRNHDFDSLKEWMDYQKVTDLETCSVKQLRLMARDLRLQDYNYMPKDILIERIRHARQNDSGDQRSPQGDDLSRTTCGHRGEALGEVNLSSGPSK